MTMETRIFSRGDLLVTGQGEVVVDEVLPRSRALLFQPEEYITVEFDPNEVPPPCTGGGEDELDWKLFLRKVRHDDELRLKISWSVNSARTILWQIKVLA